MSVVHTFLFADPAGVTAHTEAHGDESAAGLSTPIAHAAGAMAAVELDDLGQHTLRHVSSPVCIYSASRSPAAGSRAWPAAREAL